MGQAAKYIDYLVKMEKQSNTCSTNGSKTFDLPGLKAYSEIEQEMKDDAKREYTLTVRRLRELNKELGGLKGEARKQKKQEIKHAKDHLHKMAFKIGKMSPSEETFGFEEACDAK